MDKDKAILLCTIVFLVVAMRVARPFKNIQLFLFNSLRAVLGMGNEMVLHAMDLINPVLAVVSGKSKDKYKS